MPFKQCRKIGQCYESGVPTGAVAGRQEFYGLLCAENEPQTFPVPLAGRALSESEQPGDCGLQENGSRFQLFVIPNRSGGFRLGMTKP